MFPVFLDIKASGQTAWSPKFGSSFMEIMGLNRKAVKRAQKGQRKMKKGEIKDFSLVNFPPLGLCKPHIG